MRSLAATHPELVFPCLPLAANASQREFLSRQAFAAALLVDQDTALRHLAEVIDRPWIADAGFPAALRLARRSPGKDTSRVLIAAARRNPSLALLEVESYVDLPLGPEIFEAAAMAAPDEAVGLRIASVRRALSAGKSAEMRVLAQIAGSESAPPIRRERTAMFFEEIARGRLTLESASSLASDDRFFAGVARLRLAAATAAEADRYDRALERTARQMFRAYEDHEPNVSRLAAAELCVLLAYGRAEEDDRHFNAIFDRFLAHHLQREGLPDLPAPIARRFLVAASEHRRLSVVASGIRQSLDGLTTLEDLLAAAEILIGLPAEAQRTLRPAIEAHRADPLYGLLAASVGGDDWALARAFQRYFRPAGKLNAQALFDAAGVSIQRHYFYDDGDGAESFESFRRQYAHDPAWSIEDRGGYLLIRGRGHGRTIEIYANKPGGNVPVEMNLQPAVVVHRGHSYYVERTLQHLTAGSKLVYLGSCRGLVDTAAVAAAASNAQLIVTRGVGTLHVNDPLLKAISDELLKGGDEIVWASLWKKLAERVGGGVFKDYLPPDRNRSALLVRAYYEYLSSGRQP